MILMHILQFLSDEGHGTIDTNLFWETMPLEGGVAKDGVAIFSRGGPLTYRNNVVTQSFDLYSRHENDLIAADKLEKIWETITKTWPTLTLPTVPKYSNKTYENTTIHPTANIENIGKDEENKTVFRFSADVIYRKD